MGCGASVSKRKPSPYMLKYFDRLHEHVGTDVKMQMENPEALIELACDHEAYAKYLEEQAQKTEQLRKDVAPLIEKSFAHHDKSGDGVLSKDESSLFFYHFVDAKSNFEVVMGEFMGFEGVRSGLKALENMLGHVTAQDKKIYKKKAEKEVKRIVALIKQKSDEQREEYKRHKIERDAAAFQVLDVNGDGRLQKNEVVRAFMPEDPKQMEFLKAFGFEALTGRQLESVLQAEAETGCATQ